MRGDPLQAEVAVKAYIRSALSDSDLDKIKRELYFFRSLEHPNIVKGITSMADPEAVFLVQEYCQRGAP